jgi:hypothetical protein
MTFTAEENRLGHQKKIWANQANQKNLGQRCRKWDSVAENGTALLKMGHF